MIIAVARSIGHAVATAHKEQLLPEIKELVLTAMSLKEKHFKI